METGASCVAGASTRTPTFARSAHRDRFAAQDRNPFFGFRVVRTVTPEQGASE